MAYVVLADPDHGGLDAMLAGLLTNGVVERPSNVLVLEATSGTVTIAVPDADVAVGLRFRNGGCQIFPAAIPGSKVRIEMPAQTLLAFSTIPLLWGLPSVLAPEGRAFVRQLLRREVRITGLRHVKLITQLTTLLSVA